MSNCRTWEKDNVLDLLTLKYFHLRKKSISGLFNVFMTYNSFIGISLENLHNEYSIYRYRVIVTPTQMDILYANVLSISKTLNISNIDYIVNGVGNEWNE